MAVYKVLNDIQLTKHFRLSEFECHDGTHEVMLNGKLIVALETLREMIGQPIYVAAGYRNLKHNAEVGGSPNSRHLVGDAADIKVAQLTPKALAIYAERCGFHGIGVYSHNGDRFVHVDVRPMKSYWYDQQGSHVLVKVATLKEVPD